jgi:sulfite exporter TauE/SafE
MFDHERGRTTEARIHVNLFIPMLVAGLLTSFHCVMMCGNMVLSYAVKGNEEGPLFRRMMPHFAYHGAKIVSYTLVGLLLGSIGSFITQDTRSWVSVVAGGYMILLGLNMTGKFPALANLTPRPPRILINALMKLRKKSDADAASGEASLTTPMTFGLMTGLMPCGPLQAAQIAAAGAGSTFAGGMGMLGFGLGTMPLMLGYGAVASYLSGRFKRYMAVAAAILIIGLGVVMMNRGATALGSPITFNSLKQSVVSSGPSAVDESQFTVGSDGVVEIPLVIENTRYQPSTLVVPKNKPVRLLVDRRESGACSEQLLIPNLGIQVALKPDGITAIDLPASEAGSFQMTCQMGMMAGTLQVGQGAAKSGTSPVVPLVVLGLVLAGGYWVMLRTQAARRTSGTAPANRSRKGKQQVPVPALTFFGFPPQEAALTAVAVVLASCAGLLAGGLFV